MATISEKIAMVLVKNKGLYPNEPGDNLPPDPQAFAVFKIRNQYFGGEDFIVAYRREDFEAYMYDGHELIDILWSVRPISVKYDPLQPIGGVEITYPAETRV